MRGMSEKTATVLLIVVLGMTLLTCLCYLAVFIIPEAPFNPYPPSLATARTQATIAAMLPQRQTGQENQPTATSIFPPTWTPTLTPTPSDTPTPTTTRTPTPTSTPSPTVTQRPTKTGTSTATRLPPPPPTVTPPPLYTVSRVYREANCDVVRIKGQVFDPGGLPLVGVTLQVGEVGVAGSVFSTAPTDANGRYVWDFGSPNKNSHRWFVVPLEKGQPATTRFEFQTDSSEVCEELNSVQITTVDWRRRADIVQ